MAKDVKKDLTIRDLGRALGRKIARLERHVRELEVASQAAFRSVEDGAIDWYDDDGVLRERIGKQADGSWGRKTVDGPVPPVPTEPDVQVISDGVVAITWDGRSEEPWPFAEFRSVRVHLLETLDEACDRDNQVGSFHAARGGTILAVTESDDDNPVYVRLVAVSTAGHLSAPSAAVLVDELDEDDLEEEAEELEWEDGDGHTLTAEDIAAGEVTFGLSHIPEEESLLGWWHPGGLVYAGVPQAPGVDFTVDTEAQTVTWSLTADHEVEDRLRVYYPYFTGVAGSSELVSYQASGWHYLLASEGDAVDRSAPGFDDSGWTRAPAAFANGYASPEFPDRGWPAASTTVPKDTSLWLRRTVSVPGWVTSIQVGARVDGSVKLYWDGVLIGSSTEANDPEFLSSTLTTGIAAGDHVLAARFVDDVVDPARDYFYADARVMAFGGA